MRELAVLLLVVFAWSLAFAEEQNSGDRLFFNQEQREAINVKRDQFVGNKDSKATDQSKALTSRQASTKKLEPKFKLPAKIQFQGVIVGVRGHYQYLINGQYSDLSKIRYLSPSVHHRQDQNKVILIHTDKGIRTLPIGHTYLSNRDKVVKNYQVDSSEMGRKSKSHMTNRVPSKASQAKELESQLKDIQMLKQ